MTDRILRERLRLLKSKGVVILDERQVYISDDVDLKRIFPEAVLYPGTRIMGARSLIGPKAKIGTEGPAIIQDSVVSRDAEVASGYLNESILLDKARAGANAHFRTGTLLEEEASTAHTVGLKQAVLMSYVTFGSLINFCDGLIAGGKSRKDHTEVGSGFIHFNFTPWGNYGDKATASLIGNVTDGVFLDRDRIFLGGLSGLVGPQSIGFGAFTTAGQVIRSEIGDNQISSDIPKRIKKEWSFGSVDSSYKRTKKNIYYISQLLALKSWYANIRLVRSEADKKNIYLPIVIRESINILDKSIDERVTRLNSFLKERNQPIIEKIPQDLPTYNLPENIINYEKEHTLWVRSLPIDSQKKLKNWICSVAEVVKEELNMQITN